MNLLRALLFCLVSTSAFAVPNVIVIIADDLGAKDLGCYGTTDLYTPAIDALATNGVRFTHAYATAPVCSPSRAGILTGRYQQRSGHETNPGKQLETNIAFGLAPREATMGNRFKSLGYATGWIGKSHLGSNAVYHPMNRGFDRFFGFLQSHHNYFAANQPEGQEDPILDNFTIVPAEPAMEYLTDALATKCVEFIHQHRNEPFFLFAPFSAAHFDESDTSTVLPSPYALPSPQTYHDAVAPYTAPGTVRHEMAAVLYGLDRAVASIVAKLATENLLSNTIIFFTSDNGGDTNFGAVNAPLKGGKTELYEGGIRVPMIVSWLNHLTPSVKHTPVSTMDILPTAIAATGNVVPEAWQLDGINLLPWLSGQASAPVRNLYWRMETDGIPPAGDAQEGLRAMLQDHWKLIKPATTSSWELYDLTTDPGELSNLADSNPVLMQQLVSTYDAWSAQMARPRWAWNNLHYSTPEFILEDIPTGTITSFTEPPEVFSFTCPELNNEVCTATTTGHASITLKRSSGTTFATLSVPSRYLFSVKARAFNGTTWFTCVATQNNDALNPGATEIWLLGLGPDSAHRVSRRVDEGTASNHHWPDSIIAGNELMVTYARGTQSRVCATGIKLPDYASAPSGFTTIPFTESFHASASSSFHGTEVTHMVAHSGALFAGQGSLNASLSGFTGTQIMRLDSANGTWVQDAQLIAHKRMEALASLHFTRSGSTLLASPVDTLVASFSDVIDQGNTLVGIRTRIAANDWRHSEIHSVSGGVPLCITDYTSVVSATTAQNIFVGISGGEIHRGIFELESSDHTLPPRFTFDAGPEKTGTGPVTGLAKAEGAIYAAAGLSTSGAGGLLKRHDPTGLWLPVYQWLAQESLASVPEEDRLMRGLTAVPDPRGSDHYVLLAARSWTGFIERIDPARSHAVTVELDVRDFLARTWNDNALRTAGVIIGYNAFTPVPNPVTGETVHLIPLWIDGDAHFLIRHLDATYEVADLGPNLRATRCFALSPFGEDAIYAGGFDNSIAATTNSAWIARGEWSAWPVLSITRPNPPLMQLNWPVTASAWNVEVSTDLATWQTLGGYPASSPSTTTQSIDVSTATRAFFRMRRAGP